MPKIEQKFANVQRPQPHVQVHRPAGSRPPEDAELLHSCHTGETAEWANKSLRTWTEFSPWRVAN